jgi:hypothetical protein
MRVPSVKVEGESDATVGEEMDGVEGERRAPT